VKMNQRSLSGVGRAKVYLILVFIIWSIGAVFMLTSVWKIGSPQTEGDRIIHGGGGKEAISFPVSPERSQREKKKSDFT